MRVTDTVLIDIDVALKSCTYRLEEGLVGCTTLGGPPGLLAIGRFSLRSRVRSARNISNREGASSAVEWLIDRVELVEPTEDEIGVAEEFEEEAARHGLEFDTVRASFLPWCWGAARGCWLLATSERSWLSMGSACREWMGRLRALSN